MLCPAACLPHDLLPIDHSRLSLFLLEDGTAPVLQALRQKGMLRCTSTLWRQENYESTQTSRTSWTHAAVRLRCTCVVQDDIWVELCLGPLQRTVQGQQVRVIGGACRRNMCCTPGIPSCCFIPNPRATLVVLFQIPGRLLFASKPATCINASTTSCGSTAIQCGKQRESEGIGDHQGECQRRCRSRPWHTCRRARGRRRTCRECTDPRPSAAACPARGRCPARSRHARCCHSSRCGGTVASPLAPSPPAKVAATKGARCTRSSIDAS